MRTCDKYENGNIKWIDNFFGILNNEYGLSANNLRIPKYPTSSADGYYLWYELYGMMRNFIIDSKQEEQTETIKNLRHKYFDGWLFDR